MALTRIGSVGLSTGININAGVGTFTGNLTVGGVLTYEDVTNVDSIGIITARAGVKVGSGITLSSDGDIFFTGIMTGNGSGLTGVANTDVIFTDKLSIGDGTQTGGDQINIGIGSDLTLYHSGSHSFIDRKAGGTGDIYLRLGTDNALIAKTDGAVELYHDNLKKLETASGGVTVTGKLNVGTAATLDASGLSVTAGVVTATSFVGDGSNLTGIVSIPSGVIVMWSGASNAIPTGYVLCDGNNSTPDLRNRFVVGATDTYSVGATGGATSTNAVLGSVVINTGTEDNPQQVQDASSSYNGIENKHSRDRHQHGVDINHTHSNIPTLPPYYALCYIMKT